MSPEEQSVAKSLGVLAAAGLIAGLGTLFASKERLTARIIVGRALTSAALGVVSAGVTEIWFPGLSFEAKVGIAAALASLGTSGLERIFQKFLGGLRKE